MDNYVSPFAGQTFAIDPKATEVLLIQNFDPTQDSIQLPANPNSEVIPQFSFSDRYTLTETSGDTVISTLTGQLLAVIKDVTGLKTFTGYTKQGTYSLVSLENQFFSTQIEANFFEPWYVEFDRSDYGNSAQKAIDAGLVSSAYEHYLKFGQFEAREDIIFAPKKDGNNTIYGSGYEGGLVGVPISQGVYTRDVKPITTGVGEVDTLIGAPGEDTFFLGNARILNNTPQPFYVGGGDNDYALIKGFNQLSTFGGIFQETGVLDTPSGSREVLTDRLLLAGKPYDYEFKKVGDDVKISFKGDLITIIEDAPPIDISFYIPGATYVYTTGNVATFDAIGGWGSENTLYEPFYFEKNPGVEAAIAKGEYKSAFEHYVKVGQFNPEGEVIFSGSSGDDVLTGFGNSSFLSGVEVTFVNDKQEGYRTASKGVGEADFAVGGLGVDTFAIGNDNILDPEKGSEVWYVGKGDEDYLTIQGFDPYKDFLLGAGEFADYSFEVIEETSDIFGRIVPYKSLEVNYKGDRVALLEHIDGSLTLPDITTLQAFPLGDERPNGLALVAPQKSTEPSAPNFGTTGNDTLKIVNSNELIFARVRNDLIDATASEGGNRIYAGKGDDTLILGSRDVLTGQNGNDRFFVQTGGDNLLTGGLGADQFWIANTGIPEFANTITDFTLGEDVIGIAGLGASFDKLTLTQQGNNTLIAFNNNQLSVLNGIQSSSLSASNFAFA